MPNEWNGPAALAEVERLTGLRIEAAAIHLQNRWKENVSVPYPPASRPGEPAHKRSGHYRRSLTHDMGAKKLSARVGTNLEYAVWLEFGIQGGKIILPKKPGGVLSWIGRDGKRIFRKKVIQGRMAPRPAGRITLAAEMTTLKRIVIEGRVSPVTAGP
jgi:phage gpG-like protein